MIKTQRNQVIALAGLCQAICLVQQIARRGTADREDMAVSVASTLRIDADDVLDVYGDLPSLGTGLRQLVEQLSGPGRIDPEHARYSSVLIFLEGKLIKQPEMVAVIGAGVQDAAAKAEQFGPLHDEVMSTLARTYQETLSLLKPRVKVVGEQRYLADPDNAVNIRALLLAGIRSVVLWRQCGGSRLKLLLFRSRLQQEARELLKSL